jgi:REP element-mobilizing transposase RayT
MMADSPLAYFFTWTTYGTWLPGDERGWVDGATHQMHFAPSPERQERARAVMGETSLTLTPAQRLLVEQVIRDHCRIRGWELHAVNVRTQHVHAVVSIDCAPTKALVEFKAWSTRRLKESDPDRQRWWTEGGSKQPLWKDDELEDVIHYVRDGQ